MSELIYSPVLHGISQLVTLSTRHLT